MDAELQTKGLDIEHGRELDSYSEHSDTENPDDVVSHLSRLSIKINTGHLTQAETNEVSEKREDLGRTTTLHNSNNSFYSDCLPTESKRQKKLDVNLVRLKPHVNISNKIATQSKRSVNENLTSYIVIKQKTFHGFHRTRKEMKTLPLTDPRDVSSNWLHRSKTDLYIEKRREKYNKHKIRSKSQTDLDGMTFGNLVQHLPRSKSSGHETSIRQRCHGNFSARSCPPELQCDRLPSLTVMKAKEATGPYCQHSRHSEYLPHGSYKRHIHKISTCVPLKVWEPSLDCVFYSRQKELTPRKLSPRRYQTL